MPRHVAGLQTLDDGLCQGFISISHVLIHTISILSFTCKFRVSAVTILLRPFFRVLTHYNITCLKKK